MPERPDLEYVVPVLRSRLVGTTLAAPRVRKPVVLRAMASDRVGEVVAVERRGHTVVLALAPRPASGPHEIIVSPMLAGRFQFVEPGARAAIVEVLSFARDEIARRAPPLEEKLRDFLHVRGKVGPCDRCGTKLRTLGVLGHDAYFCPQCQSETGSVVRKGVVDWGRV